LAEEPNKQEKNDVESVKAALDESREKAESNLAGWQRERADFSNYKKRVEQERLESFNLASSELIKRFLPVVDDMQRAFDMVDPKFNDAAWVEGFRQIQRKLQDILRDCCCTEIECLGQPFDPNLHEAIAHEEGDEGMVIGEHRKGYMMNERVLRAAQVIVGKGNFDQASENNN
jgi:molecular chaperone GrpE